MCLSSKCVKEQIVKLKNGDTIVIHYEFKGDLPFKIEYKTLNEKYLKNYYTIQSYLNDDDYFLA